MSLSSLNSFDVIHCNEYTVFGYQNWIFLLPFGFTLPAFGNTRPIIEINVSELGSTLPILGNTVPVHELNGDDVNIVLGNTLPF